MELDISMPVVSRYLQPNASTKERQEAMQTLCQLLQEGGTTILNVVASLQDWLVSEDESKRVLGTHVLAEVVQQAGPSLSNNDLHHLALFMAARLSDWPSTEPAAQGCLALLELTTQVSTSMSAMAISAGNGVLSAGSSTQTLADADGVVIMKAAAEQLAGHVQQLPQKDRSASLQLLLRGTQVWGVRAAQQGVNLVEACVAAIDGEKDPRCLLMAFSLVQAVAGVYHARGVDITPWQSQCEEVVEVLSCYFPLTFNPPKGDPHRISRQQLLSSLLASLSCSPFLAQWVIPLVLEKLSSTYRPAKEDALSALVACFQRYGKEALQQHLKPVWSALRSEMLGPSAFGLVSGEGLTNAHELAVKAAACATQCCLALGPGQLEEVACTDEQLAPALLQLVRGAPATGAGVNMAEGSDPHRTDRQLLCLAAAVGAVAAAGPHAASRLCETVLLPILNALPLPQQSAGGMTPVSKLPPLSQQSAGGMTNGLDGGTAQPSNGSPARWASIRTMYSLAVAQQMLKHISEAVHTSPGSSGHASAAISMDSPQRMELLQVLQPSVQAVLHAAVHAMAVIHPALTSATAEPMQQGDTPDAIPMDQDIAVQVLLTCCSALEAVLGLQACCNGFFHASDDPADSDKTMQVLTTDQLRDVLQHTLPSATASSSGDDDGGAGYLLSQGVKHRMALSKQQAVNDAALSVVLQVLAAVNGQQTLPSAAVQERTSMGYSDLHSAAQAPTGGNSLQTVAHGTGSTDLSTWIASWVSSQLGMHVTARSSRALPAGSGSSAAAVDGQVSNAAGSSTPVGSAEWGEWRPEWDNTSSSPAADGRAPSAADSTPAGPWQRTQHVCRAVAQARPAAACAMLCALCRLVSEHLSSLWQDSNRAHGNTGAAAPPELMKELFYLLGTCLDATMPSPLDATTCEEVQQLATNLLDLGEQVDAPVHSSTVTALAAVAAAAGHLTAFCPSNIQSGLYIKAAQKLFHPDTSNKAGSQVLACAVLAALQPAVLPTEQATTLITALQHTLLVVLPTPTALPLPPPTPAPVAVPNTGALASDNAAIAVPTTPLLRLQMRARAVASASLLLKLQDDAQLQQCGEQLLSTSMDRAGRPQHSVKQNVGITSRQGHSSSDREVTGTYRTVQQAFLGPLGPWQMEAVPWEVTALARRNNPLATEAIQRLVQQVSLLPCQLSAGATSQTGAGASSTPSKSSLAAAPGAVQEDVEMQDASQPEHIQAPGETPCSSEMWSNGLQITLLVCQTIRVLFAMDSSSSTGGVAASSMQDPCEQVVWWHAKGKLLWQQRIVGVCCNALVEQLRTQQTHQGLHAVLACLLTHAPWPQLKPHWTQLAPLLSPNLSALLQLSTQLSTAPSQATQQQAAGVDAEAIARLLSVVRAGLLGVLRLLMAVLKDPSLAAHLEGDLAQLLPSVAAICTLKGSVAVREAGLHVLCVAQESLAYHLLHVHRSQVLHAVAAALDDDKRSVRQLAVKCRRMWTSH